MEMVVIKEALMISKVHLLSSSLNHSTMEVLILMNLFWLSVGLYTYLTLEK